GALRSRSAYLARRRSVQILYRTRMPIHFEPLHKRVIDRHYLRSNGASVGFYVSDLEPLIVESIKLRGEVTLYVINRQVYHWRDAGSKHAGHTRGAAAFHHAGTPALIHSSHHAFAHHGAAQCLLL